MRAILPSATLAMAARAQALRAAGKDVISLSAGEPDFDTPTFIRRAASQALDNGATRYTPVAGTPELRRAVVEMTRRLYGWSIEPQQTVVGVGAKQVLFNACASLLDPGDEAVIIGPYWVSYPETVKFAGGVPVMVPTEETRGFVPQRESLSAALTARTRLLILNSPNNPTGVCFDAQTLGMIAELLRQRPDVFVITDDIYYALVYDAPFVSIAQLAPELLPRTLVVTGVSKSYAMTGWRIGFGMGPVELIAAMTNLQGASTSGATAVAQAAALAAILGDDKTVLAMRDTFKQRRDRMVTQLRAIPEVRCVTPGGAFYAFANLSAYYGSRVGTSQAMCEYLLTEALVAAVPGDAFGSDAHVRLSFATSDAHIDEGVARIEKALKALR
ncbi:MAG: pyridoxal phosphate-dependent aminotransferase [Deltaproteobacteria bacterium]|nr:pyridoxal phosphate-dependent aminotransferase [Deltaproteobacteria bacterium]